MTRLAGCLRARRLVRAFQFRLRLSIYLSSSTHPHSPVNVSQIQRWTALDPVLSAVHRYVRDGWPDVNSVSLSPDFQPYRSRIGELSVQDGCVLWGSRVVVPPQGRGAMLKLLHEGHAGECRTKMLAKMYVWWPKIDDDIRDIVKCCVKCQELKGRAPDAPLHPWQWPTRPGSESM